LHSKMLFHGVSLLLSEQGPFLFQNNWKETSWNSLENPGLWPATC